MGATVEVPLLDRTTTKIGFALISHLVVGGMFVVIIAAGMVLSDRW